MKHTTLKTAIALAAAALSTSALAAPQIYGQIRMSSMYNNETKTTYNTATQATVTAKNDRTDLDSGNSRIGLKGSEKLNDKLDLEYRLEYRVNVSERDDSKNFQARQTYLGLSHKDYGKVLVGRILTEDDGATTGYAWWRNPGIGPYSGHGSTFVDNSILYTTPTFNNGTTTAFVHYGMDEGSKGSRSFHTFKNGSATTVSRDFVMVGAKYNKDKVVGNLIYTRAGDDLSSVLGSGEYEVNDKMTLHSTVQYTDFNSSDNELALFGGVAYKVKEPLLTWVEAFYTDNYKGYGDGEASGFSVGAEYTVNKNLLGFASLGYAKEESGYKTDGSYEKVDSKAIEVGAVYKF